MSELVGTYRNTTTKVNPNDKIGRIWGIEFLKQVFNIEAKSNPTKFKIDLIHTNIKGGSDPEEGKHRGLYRNQSFINFNQFTHPEPTANFQLRKEHFLLERHEWVTDRGNLKTSYDPNYMYNKLLRFNDSGEECFVVDHRLHKLIMYGAWIPNTVYRTDEFTGNKTIEYWMSWPLNIVPFYIMENGIWRQDMTLQDPAAYNELLKEYQKARKEYLKINK